MADNIIDLPDKLLTAIHSKSPSEGYTHTFYRYPARFSPEFARTAIQTFTNPGDVVLDPFMGGATTLVEALVAGRQVIGSDINPLARFVAQAKTTILSEDDYNIICNWVKSVQPQLTLRQTARRDQEWLGLGYQKHVPWPIRKTIELVLSEIDKLPRIEQRRLVRCALLRTGQWALDCTINIPSAASFRDKFYETLQAYFDGLTEMNNAIKTATKGETAQVVCLNVPAAQLSPSLWEQQISRKPNLVVTSPPYPNVHVLYHRWQIKGRKEIPTPFWIVNELDGNGASFYTMGSRTNTGLNNYFRSIEDSFSRINQILAEDALVVQLLAFTNVEDQLPRYLRAMERAGFKEVTFTTDEDSSNSRVWRQVPLRRWYASYKGSTPASRELLLVHRRLS